jgi:hypothetical protein
MVNGMVGMRKIQMAIIAIMATVVAILRSARAIKTLGDF